MNIITIAKDYKLLEEITKIAFEAFPNDSIEAFLDSLSAIKHSYLNKIDAAFITTEIHLRGGYNSLKVANAFKSRNPNIKLVFIDYKGTMPRDNLPKGSVFVKAPLTAEGIRLTMK